MLHQEVYGQAGPGWQKSTILIDNPAGGLMGDEFFQYRDQTTGFDPSHEITFGHICDAQSGFASLDHRMGVVALPPTGHFNSLCRPIIFEQPMVVVGDLTPV